MLNYCLSAFLPIFTMEDYMVSRRMGIVLFLSVLLVIPVSASMVSFLVVETGLNENIPANQISTLWGGGLMAAFFDAGYIVTDSPLVRMEKRPAKDFTGEIESDFNEAVTAGAEYFVLGFLEYQYTGGKFVPVSISVKLYEIDSKKQIFEQIFPVGAGKNLAEEHQNAQSAGRMIVSYIKDR